MSVAFDATTTNDGNAVANHITFSHTVTGSNPVLLIGTNPGGSNTVSGITYNGVALTLLHDDVVTGSTTQRCGIWVLINPATGAHTVDLTVSGATGFVSTRVASYTGVAQSGFPDASNYNQQTSAVNTFTNSVNTVADNCWTFLVSRTDQGVSAGTGTTERTGAGDAFALFDSNAALTPAGSKSLQVTTSTNVGYWCNQMVSMAPFVASAVVAQPHNLPLLGVGA